MINSASKSQSLPKTTQLIYIAQKSSNLLELLNIYNETKTPY